MTTLRREIALHEGPIPRLNQISQIPSTNLFSPNYIQIESTTKCNMKCKPCIRSQNENFDMSFDLYKLIINQFIGSRFVKRQVDLTGVGEPLLNPNIISMVKYAKEKGVNVGFTSNFSLINNLKARELIDAKLDYLYISFDGATKQTFEKLRTGSNFEQVISNINLFMKMKKELNSIKPTLRFTVTLSDENLREIPQMIKLAEGLGIENISFNRQLIPGQEHWKNEPRILPFWEKVPPSKIIVGRRGIPVKKSQPCVALKGFYTTFDGKVLLCNRLIQILRREEYPPFYLGDLKNNNISEVWFSNNYRLLRNKIALGLYPSICKYCTHSHQM